MKCVGSFSLSIGVYLKGYLCLFQNPQYDIKDSTGTLHSGISQTATYYPYDHSLGQYQYDRSVFLTPFAETVNN